MVFIWFIMIYLQFDEIRINQLKIIVVFSLSGLIFDIILFPILKTKN